MHFKSIISSPKHFNKAFTRPESITKPRGSLKNKNKKKQTNKKVFKKVLLIGQRKGLTVVHGVKKGTTSLKEWDGFLLCSAVYVILPLLVVLCWFYWKMKRVLQKSNCVKDACRAVHGFLKPCC